MAKILPLGQTFVDLKNGEQVGITRVRLTTTSDHLVLPAPARDAVPMGATKATRLGLGFYLGGGSKANVLNIDNGSAGTEVVVLSYHGGFINYGSE
jgi:hypothetical protein